MTQWYAVRAATRQEFRAVASLRELGIEVWCPTETRQVRHARKEEPRSYPLFVGYLFARLDEDNLWRAADADGVHKVIGAPTEHHDGEPVPDSFLAHLAFHQHMGAFNRIPWAPDPTFGVGRNVRVAKGKLTGALGQIVEVRGDKRIAVDLALFGRIKRVELPIAELEAA